MTEANTPTIVTILSLERSHLKFSIATMFTRRSDCEITKKTTAFCARIMMMSKHPRTSQRVSSFWFDPASRSCSSGFILQSSLLSKEYKKSKIDKTTKFRLFLGDLIYFAETYRRSQWRASANYCSAAARKLKLNMMSDR